ncbi:MAG: FecR domain-containing protein [Reichenbachiella sp.]|uniref:FecR family protein n=1 Tax=Reichenbachiella sp. TaxID=2184521 RepID=UPI003266327F
MEFNILAYLKGELDETERFQVEQWVALSKANKRAFDEIEKIYQASLIDTEYFQPDVDQAWDTVSDAINKKSSSSKTWLYRLAAMITLAIGLGFAVHELQFDSNLLVERTSNDETRKIELADGSVVWLNENSVFKFSKSFDEDERVVTLDGQAYFDIAKDPNRPFIISGEKTTVEVLGTSFNLISTAKYSNINVTSGRVAFALADDREIEVVLHKGTQATFEKNQLIKNESFNDNAASWMTKDFVFKSSPLSQVVNTLSEHFDVKIKVDDTIKNCLITSSFENKDLDEILATLEAIANIKNEKKGKVIRLSGPGC